MRIEEIIGELRSAATAATVYTQKTSYYDALVLAVEELEYLEKLRAGIKASGYGILQASSGITIQDTSGRDRAKYDDDKTTEIIVKNIDLEEEIEAMRFAIVKEQGEYGAVIRDLRKKLAEAGIEGSPPPGRDTVLGMLEKRVADLKESREVLMRERDSWRTTAGVKIEQLAKAKEDHAILLAERDHFRNQASSKQVTVEEPQTARDTLIKNDVLLGEQEAAARKDANKQRLLLKDLDRRHRDMRVRQEELQRELYLHRKKAGGDYWAWDPGLDNHLESLTCPVLIGAAALRELLQPAGPRVLPPLGNPERLEFGGQSREG